MLFRRAHFSLTNFLFARKKESWKPFALHRGRHPGRGAAGLLVTNGVSRLELKSPTGRCLGDARATHQKHPSGMFLRSQKLRNLATPVAEILFPFSEECAKIRSILSALAKTLLPRAGPAVSRKFLTLNKY
jgi:hypothetical protein